MPNHSSLTPPFSSITSIITILYPHNTNNTTHFPPHNKHNIQHTNRHKSPFTFHHKLNITQQHNITLTSPTNHFIHHMFFYPLNKWSITTPNPHTPPITVPIP